MIYRTWITLREFLFSYLNCTYYDQLEAGIILSTNKILPNAALKAYDLEALVETDYANEAFMKDESNILFTKYICPSCRDLFVGWKYSDQTDAAAKSSLVKMFFNRFIQILNNTYEKYKYMIDTYAAQKANLLEKVQSISVTKFNDTPQVKNTGEYDDSYNSSVTTNNNSTELNTLMARIAEIDVNMRNLYQDWAKEFGGLWIYE